MMGAPWFRRTAAIGAAIAVVLGAVGGGGYWWLHRTPAFDPMAPYDACNNTACTDLTHVDPRKTAPCTLAQIAQIMASDQTAYVLDVGGVYLPKEIPGLGGPCRVARPYVDVTKICRTARNWNECSDTLRAQGANPPPLEGDEWSFSPTPLMRGR